MTVRTLTREELTAALAARQMLIARERVTPAEAIRRLTPLQGQHAPAPYIALAARVDGFARADLEAAIAAREVVKTTVMRNTLHLAAADEYPAYAQLARATRMRSWRKRYAHLDERAVAAELRRWLRTPRSNAEIRERVGRYEGVGPDEPWGPIDFVRTLLPLVQLPPSPPTRALPHPRSTDSRPRSCPAQPSSPPDLNPLLAGRAWPVGPTATDSTNLLAKCPTLAP